MRRVYVLTDGEIHDAVECAGILTQFPPMHIEVNAFGFGTEFSPDRLKSLLDGQIGGAVKPICDHEAIVPTFARLAHVNRRLIAPMPSEEPPATATAKISEATALTMWMGGFPGMPGSSRCWPRRSRVTMLHCPKTSMEGTNRCGVRVWNRTN